MPQHLGFLTSGNDSFQPRCDIKRPEEKMVQQLDIIHAVAEKQGLDFDFLLADLSQQAGFLPFQLIHWCEFDTDTLSLHMRKKATMIRATATITTTAAATTTTTAITITITTSTTTTTTSTTTTTTTTFYY